MANMLVVVAVAVVAEIGFFTFSLLSLFYLVMCVYITLHSLFSSCCVLKRGFCERELFIRLGTNILLAHNFGESQQNFFLFSPFFASHVGQLYVVQ